MSLTSVLWLVRHGDREDFVDPDWGRTAERPQDPGLSPEGFKQATAAGKRLETEGIRRIFTSPYLRCAQTAHLIAASVRAPVHIEPGLGELNHPDWSEGVPTLLSLHALEAMTGSFDVTHEPIHTRSYPETIEEAFARAGKTARAITERYEGPLLFCGHAVSVIGVVRALTGEAGEVACPTASLARLDLVGGVWRLAFAGDTSHLADATRPAGER